MSLDHKEIDKGQPRASDAHVVEDHMRERSLLGRVDGNELCHFKHS